MSSRKIRGSKKDYENVLKMLKNDVMELTKLVRLAAILLKNLGHEREASRLMYALTGEEQHEGDGDRHREPGTWKELDG